MWGGHSCPPAFDFEVGLLFCWTDRRTEPCEFLESFNPNTNVKSGGQECPPHTCIFGWDLVLARGVGYRHLIRLGLGFSHFQLHLAEIGGFGGVHTGL
jgi:hypothetical protein